MGVVRDIFVGNTAVINLTFVPKPGSSDIASVDVKVKKSDGTEAVATTSVISANKFQARYDIPVTGPPGVWVFGWQSLTGPISYGEQKFNVVGSAFYGVGGGNGGGSSVSDHGSLTGLLDDDHTQYVLRTDDLGDLDAPTVDTGEDYRIIMFSDGTTKAIPVDAVPPSMPTGLARTIRVNSVNFTWNAAVGATQYIVYRNGVQLAMASSTSYRDNSVITGQTYSYAVQAVSVYGLRSAITAALSAFVDPALNIAPTIEVRSWPTTIALGNRAIIRVNALDFDAQVLALALGTDIGSLVATADPSIWILDPV